MSYKSREKKRSMRGEQREAEAARRNRNTETAQRWFLTLVSKPCSCNMCGGALRKGREMFYRHTPRSVVCTTCGESAGIRWRPSIKWEQARRRRRR